MLFKKIIILIAFLVLFVSPAFVFAYDFGLNSGISETGEQAGYFETQLSMSLPQLIGLVVRVILLFVGVFFLILTIYAGFVWMLSAGNEEKMTKSKQTLSQAVIGLIIIILSYAFTIFIGNLFQ